MIKKMIVKKEFFYLPYHSKMSSSVRQPKIFFENGFSTKSQMKLSSLLQFLVVCMIISATKPQTAEWMDDFMRVPIIILQNIFKSRGITLKGVLKELKEGVGKHKKSGKPFGISAFLCGQNPSFTLNDNFFVFFKELVNQVLRIPEQPQVEPKLDPQVEPQVEPDQCWCSRFSKVCDVCVKKCTCMNCIGSPCDKFLPAINFMRNTSYNFLRNIVCIRLFLAQRFTGMQKIPFHTIRVFQTLTQSKCFEMGSFLRNKMSFMSFAVTLSKLLCGNFTNFSYGGLKIKYKMENLIQSLCFSKYFQNGRILETKIPWHNEIRGMILYSFNYVLINPDYYSFLVSVALNPNPFRWIFDNWKQFSRISISIEEEVRSIRWSSPWKRQRYDICCQSEIVRQMIISYRNAILYGNYEENGSFPDFLKGLVRDLDLKDPSQDDNECVKKLAV
jgi:hypothetical protein